MDRRSNLQQLLENLLGSKNVYFQPPSTIQMKYPAIVYSRQTIVNTNANNFVYLQKFAYNMVVIDSDPDSEIVEKVAQLPLCKHNRSYKSENLNHDAFTIYY